MKRVDGSPVISIDGGNIIPDQHWIGAPACTRAPLFRREFGCKGDLKQATLIISGLGYHEAWLNGNRVSDHVLDPAQTDYDQRVFYVTHDVTALVCDGNNAIGVVLGNGFYNQERVWGANGLVYGTPRLLVELHLVYADGTAERIHADSRWKWHEGPITANNVYAGECYDARLEVDNWRLPGLADTGWQQAESMPAPGGELVEQLMPPIRRIETLRPVGITTFDDGTTVVDFGQNFAGWTRINVEAPVGTEIILRSAETVFADGSIDTASTGTFATTVEQVDRYICKGKGIESWEPRFTYHGFRYVEVSGWPGVISSEQISGIVIHNDLPVVGSFTSSDERLNRLHQMALWTHRSNMHGIPEDCPAREKCGWLGDANLVAEYSLWNYESAVFWCKFLEDIETTRQSNAGLPANIAPGKRCTDSVAQPDWAAAFIMLPWYLYLFTGDLNIVRRHWSGMTQLFEHFRTIADNWILQGGYGDFFDPGTDSIVTHTPQALSTTLWFFRCADVMALMADAMGDSSIADHYRKCKRHIAGSVRRQFYDSVAGSFRSQTGNTLALAFDVLPDQRNRLLNSLVKDIHERDQHMNVGVMGVRYILEILTRGGHGELALALMHQDSYPSFGHLIERGATTLWECWGEEEHNGTHGPRSLNHPFMGGYDNWFFNTLAGIRPDPAVPGFKHLFFEPYPVTGLSKLCCHHECRHGRIESNWRIEDGVMMWDVAVPPNTSATVVLPGTCERVERGAGRHQFQVNIRKSKKEY